ncbi:response regulator [Candidatus Saccharibacteria bacterium]|nr:response regulator [Candidatus Saccharibacteria bacterium]
MSARETILIVEDEVSLLNILQDKLTREGFNVLAAKNGKEGLDVALSEHPDLILLDIDLPVMDGVTTLQGIRADPWGKIARVIMLTNSNDYKSVADTLALGSYDYLVKSDWKLDDLMTIVHEKFSGQPPLSFN